MTSLRKWLAAIVFGLIVVLPTLPLTQGDRSGFRLEYEIATTTGGVSQLFYDVGNGLREQDSVIRPFWGTARYCRLALPIPEGTIKRLRFDFTNGHVPARLRGLRIADRNGLTVRALTASDLVDSHQVRDIVQEKDCIILHPEENANDPHVDVKLEAPLVLEHARVMDFLFWLLRAAPVAVLTLLASSLISKFRIQLQERFKRLASRRLLAVFLAASLSVLLCDYAVIFGGHSYISPNFEAGSTWLYDGYPSLPGSKSTRVVKDNGSDVGAIAWYHYPVGVLQGRALASGEFPWWNRYNDLGTTFVGQGQSMVGDPLQFLVDLAGNAPWAWDAKYTLARILFCFAGGLLALLLTESLGAGVLVAASAAWTGFMLFRLNHPAIFSFCYAPWVLVFWLLAVRAKNVRQQLLSLGGLILAETTLLNSGTVKEAYMLLAFTNACGFLTAWFQGDTFRARVKLSLPPLVAAFSAALMNAPVWVTFLKTLATGYSSYQTPVALQIQPSLFLGAFDEAFYRLLTSEQLIFNPSLNLFLGLGVLYSLATLRLHWHRGEVKALLVSAAAAASLAFGVIPAHAIRAIPFLGNVAHIDNCFSLALFVTFLGLAGLGYATAFKRFGTAEFKGDLTLVALFFLGLLGAWLGFRQVEHRSSSATVGTFSVHHGGSVLEIPPLTQVVLVSLVLSVLILLFTLQRISASRRVTWFQMLTIATCLFGLHWRFAAQSELVGLREITRHLPDRVGLPARSEGVETMLATQAREPSRVVGINHNLAPGWTGVHRLEGINGADAVVNRHYQNLVSNSPLQMYGWGIYVIPGDVARVRPFLDSLNVRYYGDYRSDQGLLGRSLKPVKMTDLDIYESPTCWPRAFFTDAVAIADNARAYAELVMKGDGRPFAAATPDALVEGLRSLSHDVTSRTVVAASDYRLSTNRTDFTVQAPSRGVVVLLETWADGGMEVLVDGKPAKPLRINEAFRGVLIETAGVHRISYGYRPPGYGLSLTLCLAGLALAAAGSWVLSRRHA